MLLNSLALFFNSSRLGSWVFMAVSYSSHNLRNVVLHVIWTAILVLKSDLTAVFAERWFVKGSNLDCRALSVLFPVSMLG